MTSKNSDLRSGVCDCVAFSDQSSYFSAIWHLPFAISHLRLRIAAIGFVEVDRRAGTGVRTARPCDINYLSKSACRVSGDWIGNLYVYPINAIEWSVSQRAHSSMIRAQ